jgi:hypothetical protein
MKRRDFFKAVAVAAVLPPAAASVPASPSVIGPWVLRVPSKVVRWPDIRDVMMYEPAIEFLGVCNETT